MDVFKKDPNKKVPDFGSACDGDADRNIIFGPRMLVSPSDSLAAITNNSDLIKALTRNGPLKGVARSMPTSGAVDRVAKKKGLDCLRSTNWLEILWKLIRCRKNYFMWRRIFWNR